MAKRKPKPKRGIGGRSLMQLAALIRGGTGAGKHDPRPKRQRTRSAAKRAALRNDD